MQRMHTIIIVFMRNERRHARRGLPRLRDSFTLMAVHAPVDHGRPDDVPSAPARQLPALEQRQVAGVGEAVAVLIRQAQYVELRGGIKRWKRGLARERGPEEQGAGAGKSKGLISSLR